MSFCNEVTSFWSSSSSRTSPALGSDVRLDREEGGDVQEDLHRFQHRNLRAAEWRFSEMRSTELRWGTFVRSVLDWDDMYRRCFWLVCLFVDISICFDRTWWSGSTKTEQNEWNCDPIISWLVNWLADRRTDCAQLARWMNEVLQHVIDSYFKTASFGLCSCGNRVMSWLFGWYMNDYLVHRFWRQWWVYYQLIPDFQSI